MKTSAPSTTEPSGDGVGARIDRGGFAHLAQRISAWTSRSLVTVIILLAGVSFGRQVLEWWAEVPEGQPSPLGRPVDGLGEPGQTHVVEFGDATWSFGHQSVSGSPEVVAGVLRARCRRFARRAAPGLAARTANEEKFFQAIAGRKPVDREPGRWALYELREPLPIVVVTQPAAQASPRTESPEGNPSNHRVVGWAIGVPAGQDRWALLAFHPTRLSAGERARSLDVPLPPRSERLLCLEGDGGEALVSFRGPADVEAWQAFFPAWLKRSGGRVVQGWRSYGMTWHLRGALGPDPTAPVVDVRFGPAGSDRHGGLRGLLVYTPSTSKTKGEGS